VAESPAGERGSRENPPGDPEEPALWLEAMGVKSGQAIRVGEHHAEPRPAEKRLLTPFPPFEVATFKISLTRPR
jgi:hypothetical protein